MSSVFVSNFLQKAKRDENGGVKMKSKRKCNKRWRNVRSKIRKEFAGQVVSIKKCSASLGVANHKPRCLLHSFKRWDSCSSFLNLAIELSYFLGGAG
jgi:hypothetical protein